MNFQDEYSLNPFWTKRLISNNVLQLSMIHCPCCGGDVTYIKHVAYFSPPIAYNEFKCNDVVCGTIFRIVIDQSGGCLVA